MTLGEIRKRREIEEKDFCDEERDFNRCHTSGHTKYDVLSIVPRQFDMHLDMLRC
jgi:hypothetical protein